MTFNYLRDHVKGVRDGVNALREIHGSAENHASRL